MLELILEDRILPLRSEDYCIRRVAGGRDTLSLTLPRRDPETALLVERVRVRETVTGQRFLVSAIDGGQKQVSFTLQKDLTDWEQTVLPGYQTGDAGVTAAEAVGGVLPPGWHLICADSDETRAVMELQGPTPLGITEQCVETFGCGFVFDNRDRTVTLHFPDKKPLGAAFLVEEANLREAPEFKSKAGGLITRLYAQGEGGVDFAAIHDGKPYVECFDFTDEVICGFWRDDRYTVPEHLLAAAKKKVKTLARPQRGWTLSVSDLHSLSPDTYPALALELFDVAELLDPTLGQRLEVQVMEQRYFPHCPEKNEVGITGRFSGGLPGSLALRNLSMTRGLEALRSRLDRLQARITAAETVESPEEPAEEP